MCGTWVKIRICARVSSVLVNCPAERGAVACPSGSGLQRRLGNGAGSKV